MARVCDVCKKGAFYGRNIKHKEAGGWALKAPRTSRKLYPNIRTLKVENEKGTPLKIKVCMKCYRTISA